jgi:protein-S-isoprenylcysteine O-methyltransferase Ste14
MASTASGNGDREITEGSKPNRLLSYVLAFGIQTFVLLASAGRLDWWVGWTFVGFSVLLHAGSYLLVGGREPKLAERRRRPLPGTKRWDYPLVIAYQWMVYAGLIVAGLDAGRAGVGDLSVWLWPVGAILYAIATLLGSWAMKSNPFFESTVRIQREVGHHPVDRGPYRWVRHPAYVGGLLGFLGMPLLMTSVWVFVPAGVGMILLVVRTALEDMTLRAELDGYQAYAQRVRFRLLPGIW